MAKIVLILFPQILLSVKSDLKLSGNLDLSLFSQTSAEKLISYLSWKFRYYSFMAKVELILSADFFQETPDLKLSGNLDLGFFRKFLRESLDRTLSGNLDLILVPQIFPGKPQISRSLEI